jgi:uncharacterized membrane protein
MGRMNQLIVVRFDTDEEAAAALKRIREIERAGQIELEDTALIRRDADGKVHVRNEVSGTTEKATAVGALIGGALWFLFPVVGIAIGAAAGALIGRAFDTGVDPSFVNDVKKSIRPNSSALFLVVRSANYDALVGALEPSKGDLIQTTLDPEVESALREALR